MRAVRVGLGVALGEGLGPQTDERDPRAKGWRRLCRDSCAALSRGRVAICQTARAEFPGAQRRPTAAPLRSSAGSWPGLENPKMVVSMTESRGSGRS